MATIEDIAVYTEGCLPSPLLFRNGMDYSDYNPEITQWLQSISLQIWGTRRSIEKALFFSDNIKIRYLKTRLKMLLFTINAIPLNRRKTDLIAWFCRLCRELDILDYSGAERRLLLHPYDRFNPRPKLP